MAPGRAADEGDEERIMDDGLYQLIMNRQSDRLDDQRSTLGEPPRPRSCSALPPIEVPEDVTSIVLKMAATRYESQRAFLQQSTGAADDSDGNTPRCRSANAGGLKQLAP